MGTISTVRRTTVKSISNGSLMSEITLLASLLLLFSSISQASFGILYSHPIKKWEEQSTKLAQKSILHPYLGNFSTHVAITGNFVLCSSRFLMGWLYRMPNEAWEIEEKRRRRDANGMIPDIKLLFKMLLTVAPPNSGNRSQVYNPKGLLFFYELRRAYIKHRCATSRALAPSCVR